MNVLNKIKLFIKNIYFDSLHRNSFFMLLNSVVSNSFGFIFSIIIARYYSPVEVGLASTIISTSSIITSISNLGFVTGIIMFLPTAKEAATKLINSIMTLVTLITVFITVIYLININTLSKSLLFIVDSYFYTVIFIIATVAAVLVLIQDSIFIALRKSEYLVFKNLVFGSRLVFPFLLISFGSMGIFASYCIANLLAIIIGNYCFFPRIIKDYSPKIYIKNNIIKKILKYSLGNNIANIFQMLPGLILPIIITDVLNPSSTAFFYVAWTITAVLYIVPKSITTPLFAEISHDESNFSLEIKKAIKLIIILIIPCTFIFMFIGGKLLLLYGEEYAKNSFQLLIILIVAVIPISINEIYYTVWRFEKKINYIIIATGLITFFTIIAGYILSIEYNLIGFGFAWFISNLLISIYCISDLIKRIIYKQKICSI